MRISKIAFRLGLFAALAAACALGQTKELTASEQSYREARRVLDAGLAAYGGLDALRAIENFTIRHEGHTVHRHQSRRTDAPYERTPLSGTLIVDARRGRLYHDNKGSYPGGFNWHWGLMTNGKDAARVTFLERRINSTQAIPPQALRGRLRWLPHNLLISAHERSVQLHSLGRANFDKRPHDVLTYATEEGVQLTLYLDARTHLVSKFELLTGDPYFGDSVQEIIFPGHRAVGQFQVPTARVTRLMGEVVEEIPFVEVAFNKTYGDEQFKAPAGFAAPATAAAPVENPPSNKLAENVYLIRGGGYNVLAVGFKDHVMVVETPGGDSTSREVIARVKELMPGKPIKYAAVTHHHDDHAGGVRTYIAEGATIITTPGLRSFFERVAAARNFTFNPDTLTRSPRPLSLETLRNGKRVFTDGAQTIELYDIGSGPHMDEMIVAYLPQEKIVFQGDLLNRPEDGRVAPGNATTAHFADWLKKSGLAVERIVGVHGPVSTLDDLHKSVALMRAQN
ncbi:MAG: MBL fold metallo-hydrolase [Acidobacteria bacterium]|nr:MBL fold metallo-hydrolase [Acidobacteriota bacterium]